jgi:signal transduction histidine kinase
MRLAFNRYYVKLSSLFLLLLLAMGIAQVFFTMSIMERRQIEIDQIVNWQLAEDMVVEIEPFLGDTNDLNEIGSIIHYMMVLNPAIEIYVLDADGQILAFFAEPGKEVKDTIVDLSPIEAFVDGMTKVPIFGDDPRHPGKKKHFTAAPIDLGNNARGYLYIVLRSTVYDLAENKLGKKYLSLTLIQGLVLAVVFVGFIGLVLFALITKPLRAVVSRVREFERGEFDRRIEFASKDEIGELSGAFNRMADTIAANLDRLKQTDRLRRELIANVSHDLRSPLTSIQGFAETLLMKQKLLTEEQNKRYLEVILSDAASLNKLVHELFELSKFEAKQITPHLEDFSLTELIQDVVLKTAPRAKTKQIELAVKLPEKMCLVRADIHMIERVLANLIDNALSFTSAGGNVSIALIERNGAVRVIISDDGVGIPEDEIPFIFDRFHTTQTNRHRDRRGSGLGLSICQKILELHGSRIYVKSNPGEGSEFYFDLSLV